MDDKYDAQTRTGVILGLILVLIISIYYHFNPSVAQENKPPATVQQSKPAK